MNQPTKTRQTKQLTPRNLLILLDIARYHLMSTKQVYEIHFAPNGSKFEAAAALLGRLEKSDYVRRTFTYGRTRTTAVGLSKTRPDSVWFFPPQCQLKLKYDLSQQGRLSEYDPFLDHVRAYNKDQSFSDQSLPHEVNITHCLQAIDFHAPQKAHISSHLWIRTSPQHVLTSTRVHYTGANNKGRIKAINPDFVVYTRWWDGGGYKHDFLLCEFESGTNDGYEYRDKKVIPFREWIYQGRKPELRNPKTRYFDEIAQEINFRWGLDIPAEDDMSVRILTISTNADDSKKLFTASTAVPSQGLFLFTTLDEFMADPFGKICLRKREFQDSGLLDEFLARELLVEAKKLQPSQQRLWVDDAVSNQLEKVSIHNP